MIRLATTTFESSVRVNNLLRLHSYFGAGTMRMYGFGCFQPCG